MTHIAFRNTINSELFVDEKGTEQQYKYLGKASEEDVEDSVK